MLAKHATPDYIGKCDEEKRFPQELIDIGVEQGWFALTLPEEYGGIGDYLDMTAFLEVAAYHSIALSRFWNANVNMVGGAVVALRERGDSSPRCCPALAQGQGWFAFALSENGSGSDAASLTTRGVADGDDFVIDGTKMWITGAQQAKYIMTAVRTDREAKKHNGISLLSGAHRQPGPRHPPDRPARRQRGAHLRSQLRRRARAQAADGRRTAHGLEAADRRARQGARGLGRDVRRRGAGRGRPGALVRAGPQQFGQPIFDFQAVSHMLVDMQTQVDAARMMAYRAAKLLADGQPCDTESSQAKYFASDVYVKVATDGVQIMGANGYSMEYPMQRHYRESKLFQIFGGTNQVQRNIIARALKA